MCVVIGSDRFQKSMQSEYVIDEQLCSFRGCDCHFGGYEVCHFQEVIYKDYDHIMVVFGQGELNNKIHRNLLPIACR